MTRIAICDDEKDFLDAAERMLNQYMEEKKNAFEVDVFSFTSDLADTIEDGMIYDIYLLDIYMPCMTGMTLATDLRSNGVKSPIIFLTSSPDHALEAFGVDATHYLLKPYSQEEFYVAMDKAMQNIVSHKDDRIVLKVDNEYRSIRASHIIRCEAEDKYQRIYLEKGESLLIRMSGTDLYKQLSEFDFFYRCGRAHIANLIHISRIKPDGVVFRNGVQLRLPRAVLAGLRTAFLDYYN